MLVGCISLFKSVTQIQVILMELVLVEDKREEGLFKICMGGIVHVALN